MVETRAMIVNRLETGVIIHMNDIACVITIKTSLMSSLRLATGKNENTHAKMVKNKLIKKVTIMRF